MPQGQGKGGEPQVMRHYELMYIVRPELDDDGVRTAIRSVRSSVESQGGEVIKTTLWGKRRLAYEVQRLRDGHYVLVVLRLDGSKVGAVERTLRISDSVFRHLLVLHQGPLPEPDGELEEATLQPPELEAGVAEDVVASSAGMDKDATEEDLEEVPTASDDEGDV
jgi:small subunit ribosomal protein S6